LALNASPYALSVPPPVLLTWHLAQGNPVLAANSGLAVAGRGERTTIVAASKIAAAAVAAKAATAREKQSRDIGGLLVKISRHFRLSKLHPNNRTVHPRIDFAGVGPITTGDRQAMTGARSQYAATAARRQGRRGNYMLERTKIKVLT
jgi:hypothetical protein